MPVRLMNFDKLYAAPQRKKNLWNKCKNQMKGDRDGKSEKVVQQETAYSAVVVNDHNMYPRPCLYLLFL